VRAIAGVIACAAVIQLCAACASEPTREPVPPPPNAVPFGSIDRPPEGARTDHRIEVEGWALDNDGRVVGVEVALDGVPVAMAHYGHERADVCQRFPRRSSCPQVGFWAVVDASTSPPGLHRLSVRIVDDRGAAATTPERMIDIR
jgi:hypothetical protein